MKTKIQSLIETLTTNIKKETHLEKIEKVNAGLINNRNRKFLGKPKNEIYKNKPRTKKQDNYHIRSSNPNKIEF